MIRVYLDRRCGRSAAELAYFLVLSLFPALVVVSAFVGMLRLDLVTALEWAGQFIPARALTLLEEYLQYVTVNESRGLFWAGLAGTVTSASAAFRALMVNSSELYGRDSLSPARRFTLSILFSLLFPGVIYLSILVVLTGNWFLWLVQVWFHLPLLSGLWNWARFLLLFFLTLAFLACFYRAITPKGPRRPPVLPGSILTAVALTGASLLFSWFISLSSRFSLVYGSLASVVILMVWLYLCGSVLLAGNVFNYVWYHHRIKE